MSEILKTDVIIIGGGLTGLTLAHLLTKLNIDFILLEARERLGGRIHTSSTQGGVNVEMGATWYFPGFSNLHRLLKELGVGLEEQYSTGKALYEDGRGRISGDMEDEGGSMFRMKGGTEAVINSLFERLDKSKVMLGQVVTHVRKDGEEVEVESGDRVVRGRRVVTTLPPQLLVRSVQFTPALPREVVQTANNTHTWMGDSSKFALSFASPFWRESGMSGTLYSSKGPAMQMYDQSDTLGREKFALCGFMSGWAEGLTQEERKKKVVEQLAQVFGEEVNNYLEYQDTVWRKERFTMDGEAPRLSRHRNNGHEVYQESYWGDRLYIGGSETDTNNPGYMDGAVGSARALAARIKD